MEMTPGESVIVTGAGGTIGLATTLALAARGYRVWAGVRDISRCEELRMAAAGHAGAISVIELDVTTPESIDRAVSSVVAEGGLYGVVNNAAVTLRGYFEDLDDDEIRRVFDVNLFGLMNVTRRVLPIMRQQRRGRLVNLSSIAGRIGGIGLSAYVASKFAIEGFSESLAIEMKPLGVDVVLVEPGIVRSAIWGANRRIGRRAARPDSVYAHWFARAEAGADALVHSSSLTPEVVGAAVAAAMAAPRPRLRYTVGRRASLAMSLRRHLPGELFERLFFSAVLRRVTAARGGTST
jgi:NAD(P)-dependent dehydrogenase (short-subunit alcohol dehydrogenase family)